jgi:hypothetical protein
MTTRLSFHEDFADRTEIQASSDRGFGVVVGIALVVIATLNLWRGRETWWWWLVPAAILLTLALLRPALLRPLNRQWTKLGLLLSKIANPIVLGLLYAVAVVPMGLLMRATGKDPLRLRLDRDASTYWIPRVPPGPPPETMTNQF